MRNWSGSSHFELKWFPARFLYLAILILFVSLAGACRTTTDGAAAEESAGQELEGSTDLETPESTSSSLVVPAEPSLPTQTDEAEAPPDEQMALSEVTALVVWTIPNQVQPMKELGLEFERTYGIPVKVEAHELTTMLNDFRQSLSLQAGMPDIFLGGHDWVGLLAANGVISPLNLESHQGGFTPSFLRSMSYAGQQFGVPVKADSLALVVNTDLVTDPPDTWEQISELADVHVQETGATAGLGLNALSPFDFYPVLTGFGGDLFRYAPDSGFEVADVRLDSEASLRALAWLSEMRTKGLINADMSPSEQLQAFVDDQLPLLITGSWNLPALETADVEFVVTEFPEGGRSFVNVQGYMVNAYAPDPFLAWLFLSTLVISEEGMAGILSADPAVPAFLPLLSRDLSPRMKEFSHVAHFGAEIPSVLQMREVWKIWGQTHYDVFENGAEGAASYRNAAENIKELFDGN